jgi:3-hexulose-6-phosphate synthase/6-phospho-3-hexuloisomerase
MKPVLQVALDHVTLDRALAAAREAVAGGAEWIEAGTPLIKSEGLEAVRALRREFPKATIVADMKIADAGRMETECAAKAGANVVHLLALASDATVREAVEAARRYDVRLAADMIGIPDRERLVRRARELEAIGVSHICIHTPIDLQMQGKLPFDDLRAVSAAVSIPIAVAGGINSESVVDAIEAGASIVIVGGAITNAPDARAAAAAIRKAMTTGSRVATDRFKRGDESQLAAVLARASAADVTDALHFSGAVEGIQAIVPGVKMAGPAFTVWTYPGDWAKPVQAIDVAPEGSVLVIDAGGKAPAIWGEKATRSCIQRRLAGVVIHGAIRDVANIREMKFPAFAKLICPCAGDPKGQGMLDVPLKFGGQAIRTGDWIVGDDDGIAVIPKEKVVEIANRAQAVVEREEREMAEINRGSTLGKVSELIRWEHLRKKQE